MEKNKYTIRLLKTNLLLDRFIVLEFRKIFGIGHTRSLIIFRLLGLRIPNLKINSLLDIHKEFIFFFCKENYLLGEQLKKNILINVYHYQKIKSYRGFRHRRFLPVNGQRTHTNASTFKRNRLGFKLLSI